MTLFVVAQFTVYRSSVNYWAGISIWKTSIASVSNKIRSRKQTQNATKNFISTCLARNRSCVPGQIRSKLMHQEIELPIKFFSRATSSSSWGHLYAVSATGCRYEMFPEIFMLDVTFATRSISKAVIAKVALSTMA